MSNTGILLVENFINNRKSRARPGFEPGTSRTLSENHTPRPTSQRCYLRGLNRYTFVNQAEFPVNNHVTCDHVIVKLVHVTASENTRLSAAPNDDIVYRYVQSSIYSSFLIRIDRIGSLGCLPASRIFHMTHTQ